MRLTALAALDPDRVIGRDGGLPWHLPDDLRLFKRLTLGHPVVMGRRTWESLPVQPLPKRRNLVVSSRAGFDPVGAERVPSIAALRRALGDTPAFLIGGATLYEALLSACEGLILTHVKARHAGDTYFPSYAEAFEAEETLVEHADFTTVRYRRKNRPAVGL